jgi:hypothetical protein
VAYRADIEIAVKGAQELKRLQDQVSATSKLVDGLNNYLQNIGSGGVVRSIQNLQNVVGQAAAAFNEAALGTKEATTAAQQYVRATDSLNAGLAERVALLKDVNEQLRQQKLAEASARSGGPAIRETRGTVELGPGPASPIGALVGQTSPVEEKLRRTLDQRREQITLQQALLNLEERSAAAANKELQARSELARLAAQGVNAAKFRAVQTGTQLALPAFQERGLQILDDSVKLNESQLRIERALNGERQRGVRFLEKQTAEEKRQLELGILGEKTNRLTGNKRASTAGPAGGFPVSGPLTSPGFEKTKGSVGKFGENLALGAGFPLLFGAGPGSIAGSIAGSFAGSGFGGQILGGAIGQVIDSTIIKVTAIGTALQQLDFKALEESGIRVNASLQTQVQLLRQAGDVTQARALVENQVANVTGALPGTVEGISDAVNVLTAAWNDFTAAAGVALGIIGAPLAAALAVALNSVTLILKGFNTVISAVGAAIKTTGEWVVTLIGGKQALQDINVALKNNNQEIQNARAEYQTLLGDLNGQVLLSREILNLEKQKRPANTAADKELNSIISERQAIIRINAQFDDEIRKTNEKITDANKAQVQEAVRLLNVKRAQTLEENNIQKNLEQQQLAYQAAQEASRRAKQAADQESGVIKSVASIRKDTLSTVLDGVNAQYELDTLYKGEYTVLKDRIKNAQNELDLKTLILNKEEEALLISASDGREQDAIIKLFDQKAKLLQTQANIQDVLNKNKAVELQYTKDIAAIQNKGAIQVARSQATADIAGARGNLARSLGGTGFEFQQQQLNAEQQAKSDELAARLAGIQRLEQSISGLKGDPLTAAQNDLQLKKEQYAIDIQKLNTLSAIEQQQLRVNQVTEQYGGIANAVGTAFSTSFKGIIDGSLTAKQALGNFFQSVADAFLDMAAQIIAKWIQMTILNTILNLFPGGGGGSKGTTSLGNANLVDVSKYSIPLPGLATGGPAMANTPYIVGEKGPELFMPGRSGTVIPNDALGGGGSTNVVVNVDASGNSNVQGDANQAKQLGVAVSAAVQAELVKQQRPGGLLASTRR